MIPLLLLIGVIAWLAIAALGVFLLIVAVKAWGIPIVCGLILAAIWIWLLNYKEI